MDLFFDVLAVASIAGFILVLVATPLYLMLKYTQKNDRQRKIKKQH